MNPASETQNPLSAHGDGGPPPPASPSSPLSEPDARDDVPSDVEPIDHAEDLDEDGDNVGAFAEHAPGGDFSGSEVSPAGGVDADVGDDDTLGAGDLGEGVEEAQDRDAAPASDRRQV